jgi:hypothetical protein
MKPQICTTDNDIILYYIRQMIEDKENEIKNLKELHYRIEHKKLRSNDKRRK